MKSDCICITKALCVVLLLSAIVRGQSAQTSPSPLVVPLDSTTGVLTVHVSGDIRNVLLGIRVDPSSAASASIIDIEQRPGLLRGVVSVRRFGSFLQVPPSRVALENDLLKLEAAGGENVRTLVFISLSRPVLVRVTGNGDAVLNSFVKDGVILEGGVTNHRVPEGIHHLTTMSIIPSRSGVAASPRSDRAIDIETAKANLVRYTRLRASSALRPGVAGMFELTIDASGRVVSVSGTNHSEFSNEIIDGWSFRPSTGADGSPHDVRVRVPFVVLAEGLVSCPLDPESRSY
jgi:hypothetical protein